MGRGLSDLQKSILAAVYAAPRAMRAGEIVAALDLPETATSRSALSRALARLAERKLLDRLVTEACLTGRAYLYTRHDPSRTPWPASMFQIRQRR